MSIVRNWRDQTPYIGHINAIIWPFFRAAGAETDPPEMAQLRGMSGFVKHALQGRKDSDHHSHNNIEQMYYILRGKGQLLLGEERYDVKAGDAIYVPINLPHQAFNEGDDWMEHLIVSCPLQDASSGTMAICNWQDMSSIINDQNTKTWSLLSSMQGEVTATGAVLQRMDHVSRHIIEQGQTTVTHSYENLEHVYYVLSGRGTVVSGSTRQEIMEGSAVYLAPDVGHHIENEGDNQIEFVAFAVEVEEN